jgi:hypothetical protein
MADINQLITNFYDQAIARDFSRDVNFRILQIEPGPASEGVVFGEEDLVYAKGGTVPGRNIQNVQAKYMGLNFNIPGVVSYPNSDNYTLEFYCDKDSALRTKFEQWSRDIFNDQNSTGSYFVPTRASYLIMSQLTPGLELAPVENGKYKLIGLSIRNIGEMKYDISGGTGNIVSFNVTMSYHYYEIID